MEICTTPEHLHAWRKKCGDNMHAKGQPSDNKPISQTKIAPKSRYSCITSLICTNILIAAPLEQASAPEAIAP